MYGFSPFDPRHMKSNLSSMHLIPTEITGGELWTRYGSMVLPNFGTKTFPCLDEELSPFAVIILMGTLE